MLLYNNKKDFMIKFFATSATELVKIKKSLSVNINS